MAKVIIGGYDPSAPQGNSRYWTPGTSTGGLTNATEASAEVLTTAGEFSDLSINVLSYFGGANTIIVALRVNGVQTALAVAPPAGATGRFENLVNTVTVADGDRIAVRSQGSGAPYTNTSAPASLNFEPASGVPEVVMIANNFGGLSASSGAPQYLRPFARSDFSVSDNAITRQVVRADGLLSHLRARVTTNSKAGASVLTLNKNSVPTALTVTIPASTTGTFEDLTHSVAVASGDELNFTMVMPALSGTVTMFQTSMRFTASAGAYDFFTGKNTAGATVSGGTLYQPILGSMISAAARNAAEIKFNAPATLSNLRVSVGSSLAPCTYRVVINGVAGNQVIASVGSGYHEDLTHTDAVLPGDLVVLQTVTANLQTVNWTAITATVGIPSIEVAPAPGELVVEGEVPSLTVDEFVIPSPGELVVEGAYPLITGTTTIEPEPGEVVVEGGVPDLFLGVRFQPEPGALVVEGGTPAIFTEFIVGVSQQAVLTTVDSVADVRVSQQAILANGVVIPPVAVSQQAVLITADGVPCVTRWCQVWLMTRLDGEEFAFTSHDEAISFKGRVCKPCSSLMPSATEASSELGTIGNMELSGIVADDAITEFDLYSGKFDGCYVEVWEVPWSNDGTTPKRLAAGRTGSISHGRDGFAAEVLGIGAQIQQQAVTQVVTAACRFVFGDARCKKDIEALRVNALVSSSPVAAVNRVFTAASLAGAHPDGYFVRGVVTFTTGGNEDLRAEVKEYDGATGTFVLWTALPKPIIAGDGMSATPGCELSRDACIAWANLINFGGFPDVPGDDATSRTPDARY